MKQNPKKLFDKIKEYENQGKPYRKFEITNSDIKKIKTVNNIIYEISFINLYIKKLSPKKIDKKSGRNNDKNAKGLVDSKTRKGLYIQNKKIKKNPIPKKRP